jgi:hypothetical protein
MRASVQTLGVMVMLLIGGFGIGHAEVVSDAELTRRWGPD